MMGDKLRFVFRNFPLNTLHEHASEAAQAADRTTPMLATRGRASFLGERSIGHMDPGSRSASLLISAAVAALEFEAIS